MSRTSATPLTVSIAKENAARDFSDAVRAAHGDNNSALGDALGLDESLIRGMRRGKKSVSLALIYRMPAALRDDLVRRMVARLGNAEPAGASRAEDQANVCTGRMGEMLASVSAAMRDGSIDAGEARLLLPLVVKLRDSLDAFSRRLSRTIEGDAGRTEARA